MPVRNPGSTWRALAIALVVVALGLATAVMSVPANDAAAAAERTAIAQLREIVRAQQRFAEGAHVDLDGDGDGEFGFLGELTGGARLRIDRDGRLGHDFLREPVLPLGFATIEGGAMDNGDYLLRVFLPGRDQQWTGEADDGGGAGCRIDPQAARRRFCAYAWPSAPGRGGRAFYVDQGGTVRAFANGDRRYEGREQPVPAEAVDADPAPDGAHGAPAWVPLR